VVVVPYILLTVVAAGPFNVQDMEGHAVLYL